jgi:hypothetical protein
VVRAVEPQALLAVVALGDFLQPRKIRIWGVAQGCQIVYQIVYIV